MNIFFPQNIFSRLIADNLPEHLKSNVKFLPSSVITSEVKKFDNSLGLIPTIDIIRNNELYVSRSFGVSFEGSLCNSYLYYNALQRDVKKLCLYGDVSSVEAVLGKILFKELYNTEVEVQILTGELKSDELSVLVAGDINFVNQKYLSGISFAEEIIETLSLPFVNYIFASKDKSIVENLNEQLQGISNLIYSEVEEFKFGEGFTEETKDYIMNNISSLVLDFDNQDLEGINQLIQLPYYHGLINDIVEVKYI